MVYSPSVPAATLSSTTFTSNFGERLAVTSLVPSWLWTTIAVIATLLVIEQSVYRVKKKGLPGDKWLIPVIGKFADSMNPTLQNYQRQWNLGSLSCVSVFNMCIYSFEYHACTELTMHSALLFWLHPTTMHVKYSTRQGMPNLVLLRLLKKFFNPTIGTIGDRFRKNIILMESYRVFLSGKVHVDYRKVLNTLFTRKALRYVLC
jgi:C-22 sterol desaturase